LTPDQQQFISDHIDADVGKLLLNPPKGISDVPFLAEQIRSRQKAKEKLPTWMANPALIFPPPLSVEQCSSEVTASYKAGLVSGEHLFDLTGGMGVDTLAFAERFQYVTYVEQNQLLCDRFRHNAGFFGKKIDVQNATAEEFLHQNSFNKNTVFFIDPARRDTNARKVFRFADCSPNLIELLPAFRSCGAKVLVKAAPLIDLKLGIDELGNVSAIYVVSVKNDCKEVLFLIDFEAAAETPIIHTINFATEVTEQFNFTFDEEANAEVHYFAPKKFLQLPNTSVLKAGAFKSIAQQFGIQKISANTHLYTSDKPIASFPGRQFEIIGGKEDIKRLKQTNVITRNYPLTPEQLLKKFGLKEGGDSYLVGFKDTQDKPILLLANKI
jgi:hypothetical protein